MSPAISPKPVSALLKAVCRRRPSRSMKYGAASTRGNMKKGAEAGAQGSVVCIIVFVSVVELRSVNIQERDNIRKKIICSNIIFIMTHMNTKLLSKSSSLYSMKYIHSP